MTDMIAPVQVRLEADTRPFAEALSNLEKLAASFGSQLTGALKHLGILMAGDEFLHAYEGHAVTVSPLVPQWRRRIAAVFAFPEVR